MAQTARRIPRRQTQARLQYGRASASACSAVRGVPLARTPQRDNPARLRAGRQPARSCGKTCRSGSAWRLLNGTSMSIQQSSRSSWLYVAGGAAVGLVALGAVARRRHGRVARPNAGAKRSPSTRQVPNERHRPLVSGSSQLPPSVQTLVGGLAQPSAAADTHENGPLHEGVSLPIPKHEYSALFHPESETRSAAAEVEPVAVAAVGSAGPEPVFDLHRMSNHPDADDVHDSASVEQRHGGLLPEADLAERREGTTSSRRLPDE